MSESDVPQIITKSSRSLAAKRRWERKRLEDKELEKQLPMTERRFDWNLFVSALGIILTLGSVILGCYFSLKNDISDLKKEIVKIETVLIIKGIAPSELFAKGD